MKSTISTLPGTSCWDESEVNAHPWSRVLVDGTFLQKTDEPWHYSCAKVPVDGSRAKMTDFGPFPTFLVLVVCRLAVLECRQFSRVIRTQIGPADLGAGKSGVSRRAHTSPQCGLVRDFSGFWPVSFHAVFWRFRVFLTHGKDFSTVQKQKSMTQILQNRKNVSYPKFPG